MTKFNIIPLYEDLNYTPEFAKSCGYFDDVFSEEQHAIIKEISINLIDTDIYDKIMQRMGVENNVLLVFFGCFAPLHKGHMHAINVTKERCKQQGKHVMGCLLFQSHDDYILTKKGITKDNIRQYTSLDVDNLRQQDIFVDRFSNSLEGELNFPYLLLRSMKYFPQNITPQLCVIVGEDNIGFSQVSHPNVTYSIVSRSDNTSNPFYDWSSTKIRTL